MVELKKLDVLRRTDSGDALYSVCVFFFSSRRRHTRLQGDWSSDMCSSDLRSSARPGSVAASTPAIRRTAIRSLARNEQLRDAAHRNADPRRAVVQLVRELEIGRASCRERV